MSSKWFVWNNERSAEAGPFADETMQQLAAGGLLRPESLVRSEEMSDWVSARDTGFLPMRSGLSEYSAAQVPSTSPARSFFPIVATAAFMLIAGVIALALALGGDDQPHEVGAQNTQAPQNFTSPKQRIADQSNAQASADDSADTDVLALQREVERLRDAKEKAERIAATGISIPLHSSVEESHKQRIDAALLWLAHHQHADGYWDAKSFRESSQRTPKGAALTGNIDFIESVGADDSGDAQATLGVTGLALLAFAGEGHTLGPGKYRDVVQRALFWVLKQQDSDGCFGPRGGDEFIYNHAYCTQAVCEHLALSKHRSLRSAPQKAVDFIVEAQNPGLGWRYGVKPGDNDTSVTTCMLLALHAATQAGLEFPYSQVHSGANQWLDLIIGEDEHGHRRAGYRAPADNRSRSSAPTHYDHNATMDCCFVISKLLIGESSGKERAYIDELMSVIEDDTPTWTSTGNADHPESKIDFYFWRLASIAHVLNGRKGWNEWQDECFAQVLLPHQRGWHASDIKAYGSKVPAQGDGESAGCWILDEHGSWDPLGPDGKLGGRVYSTCMAVLALQAGYRYEVRE